jgi:hypothetical protein
MPKVETITATEARVQTIDSEIMMPSNIQLVETQISLIPL